MEQCVCNPAEVDGWRYIQWIGTYLGDCVRTPREITGFIFGLISVGVYFFALLPQMWMNYTRKSCGGFSVGLLILWTIGDCANYAGTIITNQLASQKFVGGYFLLVDIIMCIQFWWYDHARPAMIARKRLASGAQDEATRLLADGSHRRYDEEVDITGGSSTPEVTEASSATQRQNNAIVSPSTLKTVIVTGMAIAICTDSAYGAQFPTSFTVLAGTADNAVPLCDAAPALSQYVVYIGTLLAWFSGTLYIASRIPQIMVNHRNRSTDGVSLSLFALTLLGNLSYGLAIIVRGFVVDAHFFSSILPYLVGSIGVIIFDVIIFAQAYIYAKPNSRTVAQS
ncbi:PQ loop repeat-domain-containing protein [Cladochytrium replicatum]|nr:PQ loop repeat-domain-containing protein [Cladochytrium replicatum]